MSTLATLGDVNALSEHEFMKMTSVDHYNQIELEIGNYSPECYVEDGMANRVVT